MAWTLMASMGTVSLLIAALFTLQGYWPVLPFAGLELAALAAALWVSLKRNRYREVIAFEDERIRIECGMVGEDGARLRLVWPRSSTRVLIERGPHRNDPARLMLHNAERQLELGRCLTDEDRGRLAQRLRELIHPAWRAAPPDADAGESSGFNL